MKVFLAVIIKNPAYEFIVSLVRAVQVFEFGSINLHPGSLSVFEARNHLTASFLETDCTHLVFLDSDIVFSMDDLEKLTSHESEDIVAGVYPIKEDGPLRYCVNTFDTPRKVQPDGLMEVRKAGTGFMCISRGAIEKMISVDGQTLLYNREHPATGKIHHLWRLEVKNGRLLTEDWLFCERWRELGGKVFVDNRITLGHVGQVQFPLNSQINGNHE